MRRRLAILVVVPVLVLGVAAPAAASTSPAPADWAYFRWVPQDMPFGGFQCGAEFDNVTVTGYVDWWQSPLIGNVQQFIQHWDGSMTFHLSSGASVTMSEDDWRYGTDTYYEDGTGYSEVTRNTGLLEQLTTSARKAKLQDAGNVTLRSENIFLDPTHFMVGLADMQVLSANGSLPMRAGAFDFDRQGWAAECDFFQAYLK